MCLTACWMRMMGDAAEGPNCMNIMDSLLGGFACYVKRLWQIKVNTTCTTARGSKSIIPLEAFLAFQTPDPQQIGLSRVVKYVLCLIFIISQNRILQPCIKRIQAWNIDRCIECGWHSLDQSKWMHPHMLLFIPILPSPLRDVLYLFEPMSGFFFKLVWVGRLEKSLVIWNALICSFWCQSLILWAWGVLQSTSEYRKLNTCPDLTEGSLGGGVEDQQHQRTHEAALKR